MLNTAIIGAGPYGLSVAAHFRQRGIPFRIFGRPMDSWLSHMPKGMMLKSDGFASDIYDPDRQFTLKQFCAEQGTKYADIGIPVRLDTFTAYGLAFRERMIPELKERMVAGLDRLPVGFRLRLDDGEVLAARRVVLAIGITHFSYVPPELPTCHRSTCRTASSTMNLNASPDAMWRLLEAALQPLISRACCVTPEQECS